MPHTGDVLIKDCHLHGFKGFVSTGAPPGQLNITLDGNTIEAYQAFPNITPLLGGSYVPAGIEFIFGEPGTPPISAPGFSVEVKNNVVVDSGVGVIIGGVDGAINIHDNDITASDVFIIEVFIDPPGFYIYLPLLGTTMFIDPHADAQTNIVNNRITFNNASFIGNFPWHLVPEIGAIALGTFTPGFVPLTATVTDNQILGDGGYAITDNGRLVNGLISRNDCRSFNAYFAQSLIYGSNNTFKNNEFGPLDHDLGFAGSLIRGNSNLLVNENFWGNYPGIYGTPPIPCLKLEGDYNTVTALKNGQALQGFDICTQIFISGNNSDIKGSEKCDAVPEHVITDMIAREEAFNQKQKEKCESAGGIWDSNSRTCQLP
jgi:hypothetical protein